MIRHLKYLKYVLLHKWYVFLECFEYGLIWRGIAHDWTKFLPSEWFAYVNYFYGEKIEHPNAKTMNDKGEFIPLMEHPENVEQAFDRAWNHHQKRNSHHWQYWLLSPDNPRPNFWPQSMDGGMTHVTIANAKGEDAALIYEGSLDWFKPTRELERQLTRDLYNTPIPLDMPMSDRKEMIADWKGAGKALGKPDTRAWYQANKENIFLHPTTRAWVEKELEINIQSEVIT